MSANGDDDEQDGAGTREVAYRLFAAEFDDADYSYSESDEERAPNYVITPSGARVNRLFVVGVLTEVEEVSDDVLRARVVDPTGAFVLYAGQYQPDEQAFLDRAEPPAFVAVTGKARTFQPDDSDAVYTSIRPESISTVDAETRDRWTVQTAEQTIERVKHMATALSLDVPRETLTETLRDRGVDDSLADGIPLALDHYNTSPAYLSALREMAVEAARFVAGESDEVEPISLPPDADGDADLSGLADESVDSVAATASTSESGTEPETEVEETVESSEPVETEPESTGSTTSAPAEPATEATDTSESQTEPADSGDESTTDSPTAQTETEESISADADTDGEAIETTATGGTEPAGDQPIETTDARADDSEDGDDIGDFEPGEFDLDEDEREEIEEEYGTEFQTGTEVDEPGSADIETPDPEELAEEEAAGDAEAAEQPDSTTESDDEVEPAATETADTAPDSTETVDESDADESDSTGSDTADTTADSDTESDSAETEPVEDVDIEDAVIEVMEELDDGDGAERNAIVDTVADRYGASPDDVEDAIQEALMGGRCYEPGDDMLKSI